MPSPLLACTALAASRGWMPLSPLVSAASLEPVSVEFSTVAAVANLRDTDVCTFASGVRSDIRYVEGARYYCS